MNRQARNILKQLLGVTSPLSPISPFDIAWVYLGLGEKDAALTWMDKAFAERCTPLVYLLRSLARWTPCASKNTTVSVNVWS